MNALELKESQGIVYQIFSKALINNTVSQGYLFVGESGTPMLDTAILIAQSLLCEHSDENGFACGHCDVCRRIEEGNFTDLMILDGSESSIKKDMILEVRDKFSKTALEAFGKKVYIVNACENATPEALNSLLKFLEEPTNDVYAILITYKIESLLDTIISRVQNIKFKPLSIAQCVIQCKALGINDEDAEIVSRIVKNPKMVNDITLQSSYIVVKSFVLEFLELFLDSVDLAAVELQQFIKNNKNFGKNEYLLFIDFLLVYFKECISKSFQGDDVWDDLVNRGTDLECQSYMRILLECKDEFQRYPNAALMFDRIMYRLKKEA